MAFNPDLFGINIGQEFQDGFGWSNTNKGFPTYIDAYTLTDETLEQFVDDVRYLKSLGFTRFRMASGDYSFTQRTTYHLQMLEAIAALGNIHIEWGSLPLNNPAGFGAWRTTYLATAVQAFQTIINTHAANGVTGVYKLTNENEYAGGSSDVTSITRATNVVTVVTPFKHYLEAGWKIRVTNSTVITTGNYDIASVVDDYTFTINNNGSDGTQASGKITYDDGGAMQPTLRNVIRSAATYVKTLTNPSVTVPLSHSVVQGKASGYDWNTHYWAESEEGRGDVDLVDLNIYGNAPISSNPETNWSIFKQQVDSLYADLGSTNTRITEWNTSYNDDTPASMNDKLSARTEMLIRKKDYLESLGFAHYLFAYRMPVYLGEKFPPYNNIGGGIRPSFYKLIGKRSLFHEVATY